MTGETPSRRRRTPPRRKALTRLQAEQMSIRYNRLLDEWLARLSTAAKKIDLYRRKATYYRGREAELAAAERRVLQLALEAAETQSDRPHRAIELSEEPNES